MSITQSFRDQLKVIAEGVDTNINALLNMATIDQLEAIIKNHNHILWLDPDSGETNSKLSGIMRNPVDGEWNLEFSTGAFFGGIYQLHDLNIEDVLCFMQTCENNIINEINVAP